MIPGRCSRDRLGAAPHTGQETGPPSGGPMKIALCNHTFSLHHGGGERCSLDLARHLAALGCEVHLIGQTIEDAPPELTLHRLHVASGPKALRLLRFNAALGRLLEKESFDVVYGMARCYPVDCHFLGGGVGVHHLRVRFPNPLIRTWRCLARPANLVQVFVERRLFTTHRPARVIANSELGKRHLIETFAYPADQIHVVRHGVDHDLFNPATRARLRPKARAAWSLPDDALVLAFVGNNWPLKGVPTILAAMGRLKQRPGTPPVKLLLAGKGKPAYAQQWAAAAGVKDDLVLVGPTQHVEEVYAAADVFVLPTHYDPFAVVTLEAMAMGLPVVTTAANGAGELVEDGQEGFVLKDPDDPAALADHLTTLTDDATRTRLGTAAMERARPFTHEANAQATLVVLHQAAAARHS